MLGFFRKYQQFLFSVVALFIIISFALVGLHYGGEHLPRKNISRQQIGEAIDGSPIEEREIEALVRLLGSDQLDRHLRERRIANNLLNDGVIRKDILSNRLGEVLASFYLSELKGEICEQIAKHQTYVPYQHPYEPSISVQRLWEQFAPEKWEKVTAFLEEEHPPFSLERFKTLVDLYLLNADLSPDLVKQYLLFQERSHPQIERDASLPHRFVGLFHCMSLADWFGETFIQLIAQWIHNVALLAVERGYEIVESEVKSDLVRNLKMGLENEQQKIQKEELATLYFHQISQLGLEEKEVIKAWRKVMLFRLLLNEYEEGFVCDSLAQQAFYPFAKESVVVDLYQVPKGLALQDWKAFFKLNIYLDSVCGIGKGEWVLPTRFREVEEVEKSSPELVSQRVAAKVSHLSLEEVASRVSLKQVWEWQMTAKNYHELENMFPQLRLKESDSSDAYFERLEALETEEREKVDRISRLAIARSRLDWIEEELDQKEPVEKELVFSPCGKGGSMIEQMGQGEKWVPLLQEAAVCGDAKALSREREAAERLRCFSPDGETYYRVVLLEKDLEKRILSFAEADQLGILDRLLEAKLSDYYEQVQQTSPEKWQTQTGEWKPFAMAFEELGKAFYAKRLQAISKKGVELPILPQKVLLPFMQQQLDQKTREKRKEPLSDLSPPSDASFTRLRERKELSKQWELEKSQRTIERCSIPDWASRDLFSQKKGEWSSLLGGENRSPYFFQVIDRICLDKPLYENVVQDRKALQREMKLLFAFEMTELISQREGIHLSSLSLSKEETKEDLS